MFWPGNDSSPQLWVLTHGPVYPTSRSVNVTVRSPDYNELSLVRETRNQMNSCQAVLYSCFWVFTLESNRFRGWPFFFPPKWTVQSLPWVTICLRNPQKPVLVMCDRGNHVGTWQGKVRREILSPTRLLSSITGLLYPMTSSLLSDILDNTQPHQVQHCGWGWYLLWVWTKDRTLLSGESMVTRLSTVEVVEMSQECVSYVLSDDMLKNSSPNYVTVTRERQLSEVNLQVDQTPSLTWYR